MKNISKWKTCAAATALLALLPWNAGAECKVYESQWDDYKSIVMENDLVRVSIIPESNGMIAEYFFKQEGFNAIAPIESKKFSLMPEVAVVDTNFGGYKDWTLETGVVKTEKKYDFKILKKSGESASVEVSYSSYVNLRRVMTIHDKSTLLDIILTVTNITDQPCKFSYWAHTLITPAGLVKNREVFYVPVAANKTCVRRNGCLKSASTTVNETVNTAAECASASFIPAQGWKGVLNKEKKALYCEVMPFSEIENDGFFDFWKGQKGGELGNPVSLLTSETVFPALTINPNKSVELELSMLQTSGLDGLSYAGKNICLYSPCKSVKSGQKMPVRMNSACTLTDCSIQLELIDGTGKSVHAIAAQTVSLTPLSAVTAQFDIPASPEIPKGEYGVKFILKDSAGKELESSVILGIKITVE